MTRQNLRNREPKFRGVDTSEPFPKHKPQRKLRLTTVLTALAALVLLALLWGNSSP